MGRAILGTFCFIIVIFLLMGYFVPQQNNKDRRVEIKKIGKQWKVLVDSVDISTTGKKPQLKARRGQKIIWTINGSDAYFQFNIDSLFEGNKDYKYTLKDGKELKLTVKKVLSYDDFYAIFVIADNQYATQDSPPKIIIIP